MRALRARGQGDEGERAVAGVELGREIAMRQAVAEEHGQRALGIAMDADAQIRRLPRRRAASVGADDEPRPDPAPIGEGRERGRTREIVARDRRLVTRDGRVRRRQRPQFPRHRVVLDVPSEGVETDFLAAKLDRTGRKQRAGIVDEPKRAQRRRVFRDRLPEAFAFEIADGAVEHRDSAPVSGRLAGAAESDAKAGASEAERGGQAGEPGAGDQRVERIERGLDWGLDWARHCSFLLCVLLLAATWRPRERVERRVGRGERGTSSAMTGNAGNVRILARVAAWRAGGGKETAMTTQKKPVPAQRAAGYSVHVFTASGGAVALLALYAAIERNFPSCFAWLGLALFIDGIDGTLARAARGHRHRRLYRRRRARSGGRFPHLCPRSRRRFVALRSHADPGRRSGSGSS